MSRVQPRDKRGTREPKGGRFVSCLGLATDPKTYQPSGERAERHIDVPHRLAMSPETRPRYYMHGQRKLPLPPQRIWSPGWEEERQQLSRRDPSPGWYEENPLAAWETTSARWQDDVPPAKREMRDINQEQPTSKGARVHFQRPAEGHQRSPEEDDDEDLSGLLTDDSLEGSLTIVEKNESRFEDRTCALSHSFDMIDDESAGSADDDGYVYVPRRSPHVRALDREELSSKARK